MHTRIEIVADVGRSPRIVAEGGLAVRQIAPSTLRFVGAAATPLGGDAIDVLIRVLPGARLDVGSIAASIALASAERVDSTAQWRIEVGAGASLRLAPEPTLVAGGADHHSQIDVQIAEDATLELGEHVQLGRAAHFDPLDIGSRWTGGLRVDMDGAPILRHRLALAAATAVGGPGISPTGRAVSSVFRYPDGRADAVHPSRYATRMRLADRPAGTATLTTAVGDRVAATRELCAVLDDAQLTPR